VKNLPRSLQVSLIAVNATLYAVLGYLTYLGVFAPALGTVRFWPSVFVPAVFAIAFSPLIGGLGAAIGIFISDMMIHGNPLLSLTVGVPANFLGFYTVGVVYRYVRNTRNALTLTLIEILAVSASLYLVSSLGVLDKGFVFSATLAIVFTIALTLAFMLIYKGEASRVAFAGSTGLILGSAVIGIGVWLYSQFFLLPTGEKGLPLWAALVWFLWTYITEVPFIVLLAPPVIHLLEKLGLAKSG
jgi:uncharacterized membrane protein